MWKMATGIILNQLYDHLESWEHFADEQRGCLIDNVIVKAVKEGRPIWQ